MAPDAVNGEVIVLDTNVNFVNVIDDACILKSSPQEMATATLEEPVSPVAPKAKRRKTTDSASAHQVSLTKVLLAFDTDTV